MVAGRAFCFDLIQRSRVLFGLLNHRGRRLDEEGHCKRMHSIFAHLGFCNLDVINIHAIRVWQKSPAEAAQREQTTEGYRSGLQHQCEHNQAQLDNSQNK